MKEAGYAKGAARREEMLTAAMHVIAAASFRRLSLREIARAIDVDAAHIVYYFGSRDGLLQAVIEQWDADTQHARLVEESPVRPLDFYVEHVRLNSYVPGFVHLLQSFSTEAVAPDHPAHEYFRERYLRVTELLVSSIEIEKAGSLIPAELDSLAEAKRLIALSDGLQFQSLLDPTVDAAALLARSVESLRTLAADPTVRLGDDVVPMLSALRKEIATSS